MATPRGVSGSHDFARMLANVAVVPLSGAVLFPGVVLPLQLRDGGLVELVSDALRGDGHVVTAHAFGQKPGQRLADVGCLARVVQSRSRADGGLDVLLEGVRRVAMLRPIAPAQNYPRFVTATLPPPSSDDVRQAGLQLAGFYDCLRLLSASAARHDRPLLALLRATRDPFALADILAAAVLQGPERQQAVLQARRLRYRIQQVTDGLAKLILQLANRPPDVLPHHG